MKSLLPALLGLLAATTAQADVKLAAVFGEHMVLQRDQPIQLWGWATPGRSLQVELAGQRAQARVSADGRWRATLPRLPAGGPHRLRIQGDGSIDLQDVLVGDVWLLSGQSNMEWPLALTDSGPQDVASPQNPLGPVHYGSRPRCDQKAREQGAKRSRVVHPASICNAARGFSGHNPKGRPSARGHSALHRSLAYQCEHRAAP